MSSHYFLTEDKALRGALPTVRSLVGSWWINSYDLIFSFAYRISLCLRLSLSFVCSHSLPMSLICSHISPLSCLPSSFLMMRTSRIYHALPRHQMTQNCVCVCVCTRACMMASDGEKCQALMGDFFSSWLQLHSPCRRITPSITPEEYDREREIEKKWGNACGRMKNRQILKAKENIWTKKMISYREQDTSRARVCVFARECV